MIVALVYRGGGDSKPSNHVVKIPPELLKVKPMATAVARRTCGAALLAPQVESDSPEQKLPGIDRNKLPYCTWRELEPGSGFDIR